MVMPVKRNISESMQASVRAAKNLKQNLQSAVTFMASNSVSANQLINIYTDMSSVLEQWKETREFGNLNSYAKQQFNEASLDMEAEMDKSIDALSEIMTWIEQNFPRNSEGYILKDKLVGGSLVVRSFTPAQTQGLRDKLSSLSESIG